MYSNHYTPVLTSSAAGSRGPTTVKVSHGKQRRPPAPGRQERRARQRHPARMPVRDMVVIGSRRKHSRPRRCWPRRFPRFFPLPSSSPRIRLAGSRACCPTSSIVSGRSGPGSSGPGVPGRALQAGHSGQCMAKTACRLVEPGRIYVAPPDYHLVIQNGLMELSHRPKENLNRPGRLTGGLTRFRLRQTPYPSFESLRDPVSTPPSGARSDETAHAPGHGIGSGAWQNLQRFSGCGPATHSSHPGNIANR
jgi:hypothetical protein